MSDTFLYAWREIARRRRRTLGNVVGYALAVALVVVVISAVGASRDAAIKTLWNIGAHTMAYVTTPGSETQPAPPGSGADTAPSGYATDIALSASALQSGEEGFVANNSPTNLIPADRIEAIADSPNVAEVSPYLMYRVKSPRGRGGWVLGGLDFSKSKAFSDTVVAESQLVEGKFIKPGDTGAVMVEKEFAASQGFKVGSDLKLGDRVYKVGAVVCPPLRPGKANIYFALADLQEFVNSRIPKPVHNLANAVLIEAKGARFNDAAQADAKRILGPGSHVTGYACYRPGSRVMGIHEKTARFIALFVVVCMVVLALKTQYSSIVERKNDIGILKAIGWSSANVVSQIVAESLFCALAGGLAGCALALLAVKLLPAQLLAGAGATVGVRPVVLLIGFLIALGAGLIAGLVPALAAARLRPADILRRL